MFLTWKCCSFSSESRTVFRYGCGKIETAERCHY